MSVPDKINRQSRQHRDDIPKLGEWFWVRDSDEDDQPALMCVAHLASNHVEFWYAFGGGGHQSCRIRYRDLLRLTKPEPAWQDVLNARLEAQRRELADAVKQLALTCASAGMAETDAEATLLPTLTRVDPEATKAALIQLKGEAMPAAQERIESIMEDIVGTTKNLALPMKVQFHRMKNRMSEVDSRIFALELYAGLAESVKQIAEGKPAPKETPITVRQMMLYMDEETLFDLDVGGMDWRKLEDFDEWLARPVNRDRILPEAKCLVAMRVRRHDKQYPIPRSIGGFFALIDDMERNMQTYLVMRNGEQLFRLASDVDFSPRLIPLRSEFDKPFVITSHGWGDKPDKEELVTPDHLDYDQHAGKRKEQVMRYNRVLFLIQGLLDRSKVFNPHPPINLSDPADLEKHMRLIRDEEDCLPSAHPPKWDEYLAALNAGLKVGDQVFCSHVALDEDGEPKKDKRGYHVNRRPAICQVTRIGRGRRTVRLSWPWGFRCGYEKPDGYGGYYGKWGYWPVAKLCHETVPMDSVFAVAAYQPGDYKRFLCDRYLKGEYLEWARPMFAAEEWHKAKSKPAGGWEQMARELAAEHGIVIEELPGSDRHWSIKLLPPKGHAFKQSGFREESASWLAVYKLQLSAPSGAVTLMRAWKRVYETVTELAAEMEERPPDNPGDIIHCTGDHE